eukprot:m.165898 g.165898  ORF g.165898 m.165898 type:complete len:51 (+) comp17744_c0_seq3:700-852(+)
MSLVFEQGLVSVIATHARTPCGSKCISSGRLDRTWASTQSSNVGLARLVT